MFIFYQSLPHGNFNVMSLGIGLILPADQFESHLKILR